MTINKTKAARVAILAASTNSFNDTTSKIQRHILTLAVWGVLPIRLAEWLIREVRK